MYKSILNEKHFKFLCSFKIPKILRKDFLFTSARLKCHLSIYQQKLTAVSGQIAHLIMKRAKDNV